ncbi:hypothetical protein Q5P01_005879 [Channa striata]|uniref:Uncharacterized protein n=1 Tax=Channa striata TaxID=64152 RepID=A0AA88NDI1_CHASR|nr:hypothetical protein Q5P01_005879 [Channa striata]
MVLEVRRRGERVERQEASARVPGSADTGGRLLQLPCDSKRATAHDKAASLFGERWQMLKEPPLLLLLPAVLPASPLPSSSGCSETPPPSPRPSNCGAYKHRALCSGASIQGAYLLTSTMQVSAICRSVEGSDERRVRSSPVKSHFDTFPDSEETHEREKFEGGQRRRDWRGSGAARTRETMETSASRAAEKKDKMDGSGFGELPKKPSPSESRGNLLDVDIWEVTQTTENHNSRLYVDVRPKQRETDDFSDSAQRGRGLRSLLDACRCRQIHLKQSW